jgi:ubiquinone/menaquinone biosynthesis C-methylase UbiE
MIFNKIPTQDYNKIIRAIGSNAKPNIANCIINQLCITNESKILELGCGTAGDAYYITNCTGANIVGVDINHYMIKEASKYIPILNFDVSISPYPIVSNTFDGVYFINLLQLILDKDALFHEVFRILNITGKLFFLITTKKQINERYINRYFPTLKSIELKRHIFEDRLTTMLTGAGFSRIDKISIDFDECIINRDYLTRLKSGILSSLLLIDEYEREAGLEMLENDILNFEKEYNFPKYKRVRTALIAYKK